jgi:hypothetical protein
MTSLTILSFLVLPYNYLLSMISAYKIGFLHIDRKVSNPKLINYAKIKAILMFRNRTDLLKRWDSSLINNSLKTRNDIKNSMKLIIRRDKLEKNPPEVAPNNGWCPTKARLFLSHYSLETGTYDLRFDGEWTASKSKDISTGKIKNNIYYCIEGNIEVVKTIKLKVQIHDYIYVSDS